MNPIQNMLLTKVKNELPTFWQKGYRFYEDHNDFTKVIEVQFLNIGNDERSLTIYYGIYVPILYEILWAQVKPKNIDTGICVFNCNINDVIADFQGKPRIKYWKLTNVESLFIEIKEIVKTKLYPFSRKINSLEELNSFINVTEFPLKYVATYPILNVVLKYILGEKEEAEQLINKLRTLNPEYFNSQIAQMNKSLISHGLDVS